MQLTTLMGAMHGACAVWLPLRWQWLTFSLFTCLRMATFSSFSIYTAEVFGPHASATLTGFIFLVGGLASLSLVPIGAYVADALRGDWALVYHAYTLLCLPQLALLSIAGARWQRQQPQPQQQQPQQQQAAASDERKALRSSSGALTPIVAPLTPSHSSTHASTAPYDSASSVEPYVEFVDSSELAAHERDASKPRRSGHWV